MRGFGRVEGEACLLAQRQEPRDMIDIAVGQHHRLDGTAAKAGRMQRWTGGKLLSQIRRCVEQHPITTVDADGQRTLRHRGDQPRTRRTTLYAAAIPLGQAATGACPESNETHSALFRTDGRDVGHLPTGRTC